MAQLRRTIKEKEINKIKDRLLEILERNIKPAFVAQDIMSFPVKTVESTLKVCDAVDHNERAWTQRTYI